MATLVNATAEDQDKRLTKRVQLVQGEILSAKEELDEATKQCNAGRDQWCGGGEKFINELVISQDALKKILVQDWQVSALFYSLLGV